MWAVNAIGRWRGVLRPIAKIAMCCAAASIFRQYAVATMQFQTSCTGRG
ncbi:MULTISPECIES: formate dehydrogenase N subunit beta transmembrane domain-containing protein [Pseudomonas syringae group]